MADDQEVSTADSLQSSVFTEQFMEYVYSYPILYDLNHKDNKNIRKKDRIWEDIGKELHESGDFLKKKWKNLRDTYMKYLRSTKCTTGQSKKSYKGWQWATTMERFKPFVSFAQTDSNVSRDLGEPSAKSPSRLSDHDENIDDILSHTTSTEENLTNADGINDPIGHPRKKIKTTSTSNTDKVIEFFQNKNREKMDDINLLMQGCAKTIKKISRRGQAIVKMRIAEVVNQQEMEELDTRQPTTSRMSEYCSDVSYNSPEDCCSLSVFNTFHNLK